MKKLLFNVFDRFLRTDFYDRLHRLIFGDLEYRLYRLNQYNIETEKLHERTFRPFKNKHNRQDIVIVACGPTAANYKPIPGAIHIAINRATRFANIGFDYLFIEDGGPKLRDFVDEMNAYQNKSGSCKKFYGLHSPDVLETGNVLSESDAVKANAFRFHVDNFMKYRGFASEFAFDISTRPFGCFGSTVFPALQFALWTNPKRIYLVGCDCTSTGHFYNKSESTYLNQTQLLNGYHALKKFVASYYPDTEIISINPVALKGMFSDIYQQ